MLQSHNKTEMTASALFKHMSPSDLETWGIDALAYVKPIDLDGKIVFSIHAADGDPLAIVTERDVAYAMVLKNDLEPLSVH